ncbi:MAG: DUF1080 domain-containing protein [Akkermansiaceae bacterium]
MKTLAICTALLALNTAPLRADQDGGSDIPTKANVKELLAAGFKPLFDDKSLKGWKKAGGTGEFKAEDKMIVGFGKNIRGNTFLCTEKNYADFIFIFEFQFGDPSGNSGCQFRSSQRNETGRIFGYQCEHDNNRNRSYTAGIYDESRRGWLFPGKFTEGKAAEKNFTTKGKETFKWDSWNTIVIKCQGNHIQTWLNGVARADFRDTDEKHFTPTGFIGLQVHGGKSAHVKWRRLFLKEL